ncbi:coiled-coil domain-containing protein 174 [Athalia rosae]|uniref:coiled-coil domain-containing protein 174 n=1 Tax=Athalia rosae TaxID=37344 RepID=UPI002034015F|nr:coiled-coil domain-containing protein 174 [Athalia rosae]
MNNSKKINVNYSSLVGLKAELLRKQTEVKDAKVNADPILIQPKHKAKNPKPRTIKLEIKKEPTDTDDIKAHKKSKLMLEAKTRLYETLKKTHSNKNEHFLVDFENKSESEEEFIHSDDYEETNSDPEEDWVEYQDCFGRTRKCLRRDLSRMQEKDDFVKEEVMKRSEATVDVEDTRPAETVKAIPKEPEIEMMRRKWEEQTAKLTEKVNIHYQDVLFDEARAHGVGYYEFSQDEEVRAKQQLNLDALRKETLQKQKEMQRLKELKDKMEQNRLKAARIRQRIRAGLPPELAEEEKIESDSCDRNNETATEPKETHEAEKQDTSEKEMIEYKEKNSLVEVENKIKAFGELLGKRPGWREMSQEEWINKRRKDRIDEFGPLYRNFRKAGQLEPKDEESPTTVSQDDTSIFHPNNTSDGNTTTCGDTSGDLAVKKPYTAELIDVDSSNSNDSDLIGPIPPCPEPPIQQPQVQKSFPTLSDDVRTLLSNIDFSKPPPHLDIANTSQILLPGSDQMAPTPVPPPNLTYLPTEYHLQNSMPPSVPELEVTLGTQPNYVHNSSLNPGDRDSVSNLDEDKITAGLKYLRANFEKQKYS